MKPGEIQRHISSIQVDIESHSSMSEQDIDQLKAKIDTVRDEVQKYRQEVTASPDATSKMLGSSIVEELEQNVDKLSGRVSSLKRKSQELESHVSSKGYHPERKEYAALIRETASAEPSVIGASSWETVQASRGTEIHSRPDSLNPVAILPKEFIIPLEVFKEHVNDTCPSLVDSLAKGTAAPPTWNEHLEQLLKEFDDPDTKKSFSALIDIVKMELELDYDLDTETVETEVLIDLCRYFMIDQNIISDKFLNFIEERTPEEITESAQQLKDLLKGDKALVKYNVDEIRERVLTELEERLAKQIHDPEKLDQHMTAMHFFLSRPHAHFGTYLSSNEAVDFLKEVKEGLKTTYGITFDEKNILNDATPFVNVSQLYQSWHDDKELIPLLETLPGYQPKEKGAVAKGGPETFREPTIIALAKAFGLQDTVLMKDVFIDANIFVEGEEIQTAVVSPFIPKLEETEYEKIWGRFSNYFYRKGFDDKDKYQEMLKALRTVVTPESYGESLFLSLFLHACDDHIGQFTVQNGRLINYDTGKTLPPTRFIENNGKLEITLRSVLIDYPQFEDPLPDAVLDKIQAITPEKIEEEMGMMRISEFRDPFMMLRHLREIQRNSTLTKDELSPYKHKIYAHGNLRAYYILRKYLDTKDPSLLQSLVEKAEYGCRLSRNIGIHNLEKYRDFHDHNVFEDENFMEDLSKALVGSSISFEQARSWLENFDPAGVEKIITIYKSKIANEFRVEDFILKLERHLDLKDYIEGSGQTLAKASTYLPHFDKKGKMQINDQIDKLIKASVDEREIDRMKEGQQLLIQKIKEQGSLTGRQIAETLYPEEMLFHDALYDMKYCLPSLCFGVHAMDINSLMYSIGQTKSLDADRIQQLSKAIDKMLAEAGDPNAYSRFCAANPNIQ